MENNEEAQVISAEVLLANLVTILGEDFVVIDLFGWGEIVRTIHESSDETLLDKLDALKVRVIPVSLQPKKEESRILLPNGMPQGDSKIIIP